jgi:hypothetical protein
MNVTLIYKKNNCNNQKIKFALSNFAFSNSPRGNWGTLSVLSINNSFRSL